MTDIGKIFDANPRSLADFLSTNDQGCFIPLYQRPYSWSEKDVGRLFEDTVDGLNRLGSDPGSLRFLGTIIAVNNRELAHVDEPMDRELPNAVLTIIDGQQRLCTLIAINIILHDALQQKRAAVTETPESAGFVQLVDDYLFDLAKTISFVGKHSETKWRHYPRIIRAEDDQWSRSAQHARYESPIASLIWRYIEHLDTKLGQPFPTVVSMGKSDEQTALDNAVLLAASKLKDVAEGVVDGVQLPSLDDLTSKQLQDANFWSGKYSVGNTEFIRSDETAQAILRLMAFGRYLNTRMAITVVTTTIEDYAFDMFEALNTTGQALTAFETFRPKVIQLEGSQGYPTSKSKAHIKLVEAYLDKYDKADEKLRATSTMLIPFALLHNGKRLAGHLSAQRRYLRSGYDEQSSIDEKREFTYFLGATANFLNTSWFAKSAGPALVLPDGTSTSDEVAGFCLEALRSMRHDVVIAPLVRFYAEADRRGDAKSIEDYESAIKAVAAFSILWRAARGGTANIDSQYRDLMKGKGGRGLSLMVEGGTRNDPPDLDRLRATLWGYLSRKAIGLGTKEAWVASTQQRAVYEESNTVARFLLLAACHNSVEDSSCSGLITSGGRGNLNLLTPQKWNEESLLTIEHVAPKGAGIENWPSDLTEDNRTRDRLGNLVLMPSVENSELADHSWAHKRLLLSIFSAESTTQAGDAIAAAQAVGVNVTNRVKTIAETSSMLPLCKPIANRSGDWDAAFVALRSERLAQLAWDTISPWLGSKPA